MLLLKLLFSEVDDWHFGTLHMAMMNLFATVTLDNWGVMLLINLYGCYVPIWDPYQKSQHRDQQT